MINVKQKTVVFEKRWAAQTVVKPGLTFCYAIGGIGKKWSTMSCSLMVQLLILACISKQLNLLMEAFAQKWSALANWRGILFHYDSAIPHISIVTCQKLWVFGLWDYFYLFLSMANDCAGEKQEKLTKSYCPNFYDSGGILKLPSQCQQGIEQHVKYFTKVE